MINDSWRVERVWRPSLVVPVQGYDDKRTAVLIRRRVFTMSYELTYEDVLRLMALTTNSKASMATNRVPSRVPVQWAGGCEVAPRRPRSTRADC